MCNENKNIVTISWRARAFAASLGCSFLVLCNWTKIANDLDSNELGSLLIRIALICGLCLLFSTRIPSTLKLWNSRSLRQGALLAFCAVLFFYPLFSHLSLLSGAVPKVVKKLQSKESITEFNDILDIISAFPSQYEKYLKKQDFLSKAYIYFDGIIKIFLLQVSPSSKVALGTDGFFYEGYGARKVEKGIIERFDNIADYMGQIPFTEKELRQWKRTLEERSYWLEQQGIKFVFVLAPTKGFVYPEFLPQSIRERRGRTRYEQLSEYLEKNSNVHFVDLLPELLRVKQKRDYPLLFYKTDFHWNYYGSLIAYQHILREIDTFFPQYNLTPYSYDDFTMKVNEKWAHHRFMELISLPPFLHKSDHYLTMQPLGKTNYDTVKGFPAEGIHDVKIPRKKLINNAGQSMKIPLLENNRNDLPFSSILLLGDSFFEKCVYYFSAHSERVFNYRTIVNFPTKIFKFEKPDLVIQEILNMFLLRPPPLNPPVVRQAWLKRQFLTAPAERRSMIPLDKIAQLNKKQIRIGLPGGPPFSSVNDQDTLYRLELKNDQALRVDLRIRRKKGQKLIKTGMLDLKPGKNEMYFQTDASNIEELILNTENGNLERSEIIAISRIEITEE